MKKIFFQNSRGQRLAGILHEAESDKAIILLHGFGGDKDEQGIFIKMAEALCKEGFTALRFDFAGSGESGGEFSDMTFASEAGDMKSAIEFMKSRGYKKIGVIGQSFGGAIPILGYSKDIISMVLWNPVARMESFRNYLTTQNENWREEARKTGTFRLYKERLKRYLYAGKSLAEESERLDIFSEARKISCTVLVIHGEKDSILPWKDSKELLTFLKGKKRLEIIKGAEHAFHKPSEEKPVIRLTVEWFRKYL